jgi:hypothetical protein
MFIIPFYRSDEISSSEFLPVQLYLASCPISKTTLGGRIGQHQKDIPPKGVERCVQYFQILSRWPSTMFQLDKYYIGIGRKCLWVRVLYIYYIYIIIRKKSYLTRTVVLSRGFEFSGDLI